MSKIFSEADGSYSVEGLTFLQLLYFLHSVVDKECLCELMEDEKTTNKVSDWMHKHKDKFLEHLRVAPNYSDDFEASVDSKEIGKKWD